MPSIDLTSPRVFTIADRGREYTLTVGRIARKQWLRYFEGIFSTSENQAGKRVDRFDNSTARLELIADVLTDASGYATADGCAVSAVPGWQQLIPLSHRLGAAEKLLDVAPAEPPEDGPIVLGAEAVYLTAVWGASKFTGLCHRFKTPSAEQQRRLSRDASRSVIVGGSRRGTTRWLGSQATLAELYDELIVSVEGYTVGAEELGADRDAIIREMDTYHKVAATDQLFSPAEVKADVDSTAAGEE